MLEDFIKPYLKYADSGEAYRKLIALAVMAWDASFLSEEGQQDMMDQIFTGKVTGGDDELKADLKSVVSALIARKKRHFSKYRRKIIDYALRDEGGKYHLFVVSTLEEQPEASAPAQRTVGLGTGIWASFRDFLRRL